MRESPVPLREQVQRHRERVIRLLAERGARNPRLFGSVARGDDGAGSDVDLLVDFDDEHSPAQELLAVLGLSEELSDALAMRVRVASPATLKEEVRNRAGAEAIAL
jgi:uncharacterized protein